METNNQFQQGGEKPRIKKSVKVIGFFIVAAIVLVAVYYLSPDVKQYVSKSVQSISAEKDVVNNVMSTEKLSPPSDKISTKPNPKVRAIGYAWNGASAWTAANGGPVTTEGSLMEMAGVSLELIRQDNLDKIREAQLLGLKEFSEGQNFPATGCIGVWIMGDGAPYYISTTQQMIDKMYGKGKYHVKVLAASGISYGEDKLIGPAAWKLNPQLLRGAVISAVIGDGDWVIVVNYAGQLGIPVNPDPTTYDPNAINFVQAEDADYIKAAQMLIKSQKGGVTYEFKLMKNGKRTNEPVKRKIDGTTTWFPGDKMVFDALPGYTDIISTKEYNNQMPTVFIGIDEWAQQNSTVFQNMLKSMATAGNQIKLYDEWLKFAAECNAKTFKFQDGNYWYKAFKSYQGAHPDGTPYNVGGTRAFNYSDQEQYFGLSGTSRYEAVYIQIAKYLDDLDPMGYKENVETTVPYSEAVNFQYLQAIKSELATGSAYKADYSANTGQIVAKGNYQINFRTGSAELDGKGKETVKSIYRALSFSEDLKVNIIGHTDNVGNPSSNMTLSKQRAEAVKAELIRLGTSSYRFDNIDGMGDTSPLPGNTNTSEQERAQNRRVEITLLK